MLVLDGVPVELDAHLDRLHHSLSELYPGQATPAIDAVEAPEPNCAMRIDVLPGGNRLEVEVSFREIGQQSEPTALRSLTVPGGLGPHKWRDRSLLDHAQRSSSGLPLILDTDGSVLEAARANVFAVREGALFTPPLDGRILPGITRASVLERARSAAIPVRERALSHADLLEADEVFLTGSVRGIEQVDSLDGAPLRKPAVESRDLNRTAMSSGGALL